MIAVDDGSVCRGRSLGLRLRVTRWRRRWRICGCRTRICRRIARACVGSCLGGSTGRWLTRLQPFNLLMLAFDGLLEIAHPRIDRLRLGAELLENAVEILLLCRGRRLTCSAWRARRTRDIGLLLCRCTCDRQTQDTKDCKATSNRNHAHLTYATGAWASPIPSC